MDVTEYLESRVSKLEEENVRLKEIIVVFMDHADVVTKYVVDLFEPQRCRTSSTKPRACPRWWSG